MPHFDLLKKKWNLKAIAEATMLQTHKTLLNLKL